MQSVIKTTALLAIGILLSGCAHLPRVDKMTSPGLVAFYPLDGNARDASGNSLHGTVHGALPTQGVDKHKATACYFDGIHDYIDLGTNSLFKMTNAVTISAWIKPASLSPHYQNILSDHSGDEIERGCGKILRLERSSLQFHVGGAYGKGTGIYVQAGLGKDAAGQWIHVAGTYDRKVARLYINGSKVAERPCTQPLAVNPNPILLGKSGFGEHLQGAIDQVRIHARALPDEEIKHLYDLER